jgi:hypothetical protein
MADVDTGMPTEGVAEGATTAMPTEEPTSGCTKTTFIKLTLSIAAFSASLACLF